HKSELTKKAAFFPFQSTAEKEWHFPGACVPPGRYLFPVVLKIVPGDWYRNAQSRYRSWSVAAFEPGSCSPTHAHGTLHFQPAFATFEPAGLHTMLYCEKHGIFAG